MTTAILVCHCIVIFKSEKHYLNDLFNIDEDEIDVANAQGNKNLRRKIPCDPETRELANQIAENGVDETKLAKIKE